MPLTRVGAVLKTTWYEAPPSRPPWPALSAKLTVPLEPVARVIETKWRLLELLIGLRRDGARIVGYGAPGKGNTLLNYCGIRTDLLDYTVDSNPLKHGRFLPGTHIPIHPPERIAETKPDYVLILPWNLKREIAAQLEYVRDWGGRLVVPIPEPEVLP